MITSENPGHLGRFKEKERILASVGGVARPPSGWLKAARLLLGLTYREMGDRMGISPQSAKETEEREAAGSITLRSLSLAARAMNMKLVYGLVPIAGSMEELVSQRGERNSGDVSV